MLIPTKWCQHCGESTQDMAQKTCWLCQAPFDTPSVAPLSVGSTEWVDALAEKWARRIREWEERAKHGERHLLKHCATLHDCIKELRAGAESASTAAGELPLAKSSNL